MNRVIQVLFLGIVMFATEDVSAADSRRVLETIEQVSGDHVVSVDDGDESGGVSILWPSSFKEDLTRIWHALESPNAMNYFLQFLHNNLIRGDMLKASHESNQK